METAQAPFLTELADSVPGARAFWVQASDGLRLRIAHYPGPETARGTVLIFPGRTEYVEKYGRVAAGLADRGFHSIAIDWRGQGMADRMLENGLTGHVDRFADYQRDVEAALALVDQLALPGPRFLFGHSMGGCIGLRSLMNGLDVGAAAFTGPMWGIRIGAAVRPAAWALGWGSRRIGLGHLFAPGTGSDSYVARSPFEDNLLTRDREMWDYMQRQVDADPRFHLGGPSLTWVLEALGECRDLSRRPSPDLPCLTWIGANERIVDTHRVHDRMAAWPKGKLEVVENGEHELLMEGPVIRNRILDAACALFSQEDGARTALSA